MKTTHQLAKELLALPDVDLVVEGWCQMRGHELAAKMTQYDPDGTVILIQECVDKKVAEEMKKWRQEHPVLVSHQWINNKQNELLKVTRTTDDEKTARN
jgi:hypothetical protein